MTKSEKRQDEVYRRERFRLHWERGWGGCIELLLLGFSFGCAYYIAWHLITR